MAILLEWLKKVFDGNKYTLGHSIYKLAANYQNKNLID